MSQMRAEIGEASAVVARVIANMPAIEAVAARLRALAPPFVSVAARGSSSHAGTYLRVLIGRDLGLAAAAGAGAGSGSAAGAFEGDAHDLSGMPYERRRHPAPTLCFIGL